MYQSQTMSVLEFLKKNKTINSFQCFMKLQIVDLQHAIYELRKEGYLITDKWITKINKKGKKIKYKEYKLGE